VRPRPTPAGRNSAAQRAPRHRKQAAQRRRSGRTLLGSAPFLFALAAITLVATSAVTYVISPDWGHSIVDLGRPNTGTVNGVAGAAVPNIAPNRIEIPKIHAVAPIVRVGTLANRELQIPLNPKVVGWWSPGARPGASKGTAILAGHINYAGVRGELADIGALRPGDPVYVYGKRQNKAVELSFRVTGVKTYRKTALPYKQIFDQNSVGRLAIVTCGGAFDTSTGNYLDNIVVFAVPSVVHAAS
jgi:Sortase domain